VTTVAQTQVKNRLLRLLPAKAFELLAPHLELVELPVKQSLVRPRQAIEHVCFIESGLASTVAQSKDGRSLEIRHIGLEGFAGYPLVLTVNRTPNATFMQVSGEGFRVAANEFLPVLEIRAARELLLRYVHTCELQLAHSALAAAQYNMHQRLARWLLMCHDRLAGRDLPLTHEFLALMLGVRRSGVTGELHILEGLRAIRATRGNVRILDRDLLTEIAGGCYGVPEEEYERLITDRQATDHR
jgi:CRP-like cAMP-binding protein